MIKKTIRIIIVIPLLFIIASCNDNLTQYKNDVKAEITKYIVNLNESDYSIDNWDVILKEASDGKMAIDNANNRKEVNIAKEKAITNILGVSKEVKVSISFEEVSILFERGENLSVIIKSKEELTTLIAENEWLLVEGNKWTDFDIKFFEKKALILHFEITPSASVSYLLDDIQIVDDNLKIYLVGQHFGDEILDVLGFVSIIVVVEKSDIENITKFDTNIKYENLKKN